MTTPTREQECKHEHIKTWVFEDTKEPAMWSCSDCGLKFAPEMATLTAGRDQGLREASAQPAQTEREANATARAFSLATMAAEAFVRCNGLPTGEPDEFMMTGPDLTDEYATACVDHLKWVGECVAFDIDDGVLVRLGDFTLGSLS